MRYEDGVLGVSREVRRGSRRFRYLTFWSCPLRQSLGAHSMLAEYGAPSNLRIVSRGIPSLPAISSGVGSRPITCRMFRQVRRILFKASMVATDK